MAQSFQRLVSVVGVDKETALQMAVTVPADVLKQPELAAVVGRSVDDLLVLGIDFTVVGTLGDQIGTSNDAFASHAP